MNPLHLSKKSTWITPVAIIEAAKKTMGSIDLDVASSPRANKLVQANKFYTPKHDSLNMEWWCDQPLNLFLNPPSGIVNGKSVPGLYWEKLMHHYFGGKIRHAIFVGFSLEQIAMFQRYSRFSPSDFLTFFPAQRQRFVNPRTMKPVGSPTHSNFITYLSDGKSNAGAFIENFQPLEGKFTIGIR